MHFAHEMAGAKKAWVKNNVRWNSNGLGNEIKKSNGCVNL